ncbi:MAG: 3-deoxy-7-phosphoheptulonate synthase [Arenicella sp.]
MSVEQLISPDDLRNKLPVPAGIKQRVRKNRRIIEAILDKGDKRLLVVVDLGSIDDRELLVQWAQRMTEVARCIANEVFLVVQVCGKQTLAQTHESAKGNMAIEQRIFQTRELMLDIAALGLPISSPILDLLEPQYLQDLMSWSEIGASVIESPVHREIASNLSVPVGLKMGCDGSIESTVNALDAISRPHTFLGFDNDGVAAILQSVGNQYAHAILCGRIDSEQSLNDISIAEKHLLDRGFEPRVMVDCSANNALRSLGEQGLILNQLVQKMPTGMHSITGVMLECVELNHDACSQWQTLSECLYQLSTGLQQR